MRILNKLIVASLAALTMAFGLSLSAMASPVGESVTSSGALPQTVPAGARCSVSYYTTHARLRMAERDISEWEVINAIAYSCRHDKVVWQWLEGTYKYYGTYVVVAMNPQGGVVTVWLAGGNGGGGWTQPTSRVI